VPRPAAYASRLAGGARPKRRLIRRFFSGKSEDCELGADAGA
jgi:hypothetical protein